MLKSLDRINNMIDEGKIKRIFVFNNDFLQPFVYKIFELFSDRVEVIEIGDESQGIDFNKYDCVLFYETVIYDIYTANSSDTDVSYIITQARDNGAYIKVLSEDIFCKENINKDDIFKKIHNIKGNESLDFNTLRDKRAFYKLLDEYMEDKLSTIIKFKNNTNF